MRGSVQKRPGKHGVTWCAVYDESTPHGLRRQRRKSFKTKREAEAFLTKTLNALHTGTYIEPTATTIAAYLGDWLQTLTGTLRPSTLRRYETIIRLHIVPEIGHVPLAKLTPDAVQALYNRKLAEGLSSTTVMGIHAVLHRALDQAVQWQRVLRNVTDALKPPRPRSPEMHVWSAAQARTFLEGTADERLSTLWRLAVLTGMRRGELIALRWTDVDFERGSLAVQRTVTLGPKKEWTFGEPKTRKGRRSIALPASCVAALKRHRTQQLERRLQLGPAWHDGDLVFERRDGRMVNPTSISRTFPRLAANLGLPRIRFHDLRHTAATLNLYSYVTPDMQRDAADRLDAAVGG